MIVPLSEHGVSFFLGQPVYVHGTNAYKEGPYLYEEVDRNEGDNIDTSNDHTEKIQYSFHFFYFSLLLTVFIFVAFFNLDPSSF